MFMHNKRLQYTVRVSEPNPRLASMIIEQFGGADGELSAAMRYFSQGLAEDDAGLTFSHDEVMADLDRLIADANKTRRSA